MLKINRKYVIAGSIIISFYVLGFIFPDYWWAFHSARFIHPILALVFFALSTSLIVLSSNSNFLNHFSKLLNDIGQIRSHLWLPLIAIICFILFYQFQIFKDYYGEAYLLQNTIHETPKKISQEVHNELFSFGLNPWAGQKTIFGFITYLAYYLKLPYIVVFRWFDAFFGALFVLSWLYFIKSQLESRIHKAIFFISILSTPILLNFFGHLEINAPVYFINSLWIQLLIVFYKDLNPKKWIILFVLWLIALKLHAVALLFTPALLICTWKLFKGHIHLTWAFSFKFILIPIFAIGLIAYFIVFKDYADDRLMNYNVGEYEHLFLPIFSPKAPLDTYNLFSWNHIFDYFNLIFLWSPIAIFLLIVLVGFNSQKINWKSQELILSGTTLILFAVLFFMVNPLLSMQMDWDLFSFPAPILFAFLIVGFRDLKNPIKNTDTILIASLAIGLLSIPFFISNFSRVQLSEKLISLGKRIYPTYYIWSSQTINYGLLLKDNDLEVFSKRNEIIYELESNYTIDGYNQQLAKLYRVQGGNLLKQNNKPHEAFAFLNKALKLDPSDQIARFWQMETCLQLEEFHRAYDHAVELNMIEFPDKKKSSITLVECALFAGYYDNALEHAGTHLNNFPKDSVMQHIHYRLLHNIEVKNLIDYFTYKIEK